MTTLVDRNGAPRERYGFTLIELLVVIAIIALIAAIIFPVFASAREKARQTACLSNVKQLGLAVAQYEQDYDEMTPCGTDAYGGGSGWGGQIFGYVKSLGVFECPDDTLAGPFTISYALNSQLAREYKTSTPGTEIGTLLSQFTEPTRTVLFCEIVNNTTPTHYYTLPTDPTYEGQPASPTANGTGTCNDPAGYNAANCNGIAAQAMSAYTEKYATGWFRQMTAPPPGATSLTIDDQETASFKGVVGVHNGGSNYVFADCHAKWLPGTAVSGGYENTTTTAADYCGYYASGPNAFYSAETRCSDTTIVGTFSFF